MAMGDSWGTQFAQICFCSTPSSTHTDCLELVVETFEAVDCCCEGEGGFDLLSLGLLGCHAYFPLQLPMVLANRFWTWMRIASFWWVVGLAWQRDVERGEGRHDSMAAEVTTSSVQQILNVNSLSTKRRLNKVLLAQWRFQIGREV